MRYKTGLPPLESESVPVCSTVPEEYPSMPTQKDAYCAPELHLALGTIQEPFALVQADAVTRAPLQLLLVTGPSPWSKRSRIGRCRRGAVFSVVSDGGGALET